MTLRKVFLSLTILLLILTCVPVYAQDASSNFEPDDCWFDSVPDQSPECGWLTVPADHNNPDNGETYRLAVAIFHATGDDPAPDPVIYLEGGPGGSPLEFVNYTFEPIFSPFVEKRDVIIFDQRGVGFSQPALDCTEITDLTFETLDQDLSIDEVNEMTLDAYQLCHDRLTGEGIDLSLFNSAQNAADVAMLREALGYDEVNLYGISYGTRLALTVMRDYPEGIRSVIIDSVYPPQETLFNATNNFFRALTTLFEGCEADEACNTAFPDLETVFYDTANALNENPVMIDVLDVANPGRTLPAVLNGDTFVGLVFQGLYSADVIPSLPKSIYDASNGDYNNFALLIANALFQIDAISNGMYNSVECVEEVPFTTPDDEDTINADLPDEFDSLTEGSSFGEQSFALCNIWDVTPAPAVENESVVSSLPTLVMAGEYDPITPPDWGRSAAATLDNATFFLVPGVGHGAIYASECATSIALAFLDDPEASPDGACLLTAPPVDFIIPGEELTVVPFTNEDLGFSSVVPEGWDESNQSAIGVTVLVYSRGADTALTFLVLGLPADTFAQSLALQAGGELPEPQIVETDNATWEVYQLEFMGQSTSVALAEIDGLTYIVQLIASANEIEDLTEQALIPAIEALEPLE
jgi:pimeloyl-ACP methyl ester carboxylesterase